MAMGANVLKFVRAINILVSQIKNVSACARAIRVLRHFGTVFLTAALQCLLAGEVAAHRYSSSHANQSFENWWSHSKRGFTAWKTLVAEGKLSLGNHLQMEMCLVCVF